MSAPALIPDRDLPVAGEGAMLYPELFPKSTGPAFPAAATLCRLAAAALDRGQTAADPGRARRRRWPVLLPPEPLYLRRRTPASPARRSG